MSDYNDYWVICLCWTNIWKCINPPTTYIYIYFFKSVH